MIILLGILGGLIVLIADYLLTGLRDFPEVIVNILPNKKSTLFRVTNEGNIPVTNMVLTIRTPATIINYSNYSSIPLTVSKIGPTIIRAEVPRFIHGKGSVIEISTVTKGNQDLNPDDFSAHATYDQGSTTGNANTNVDEIMIKFNNLPGYDRMGIVIMIAVILAVALFVIIRESYRYLYFQKKRRLE